MLKKYDIIHNIIYELNINPYKECIIYVFSSIFISLFAGVKKCINKINTFTAKIVLIIYIILIYILYKIYKKIKDVYDEKHNKSK